MTTQQDNWKIRQAFSASSRRYEALSGLQKDVGRRLLGKWKSGADKSVVLDVGAGTGWMTQYLSRTSPAANIFVLDAAWGMAEQARKRDPNWQIVVGDAGALPFRPRMFDLVISNLAYQWVGNLAQAFRESAACLKNGGTFCFSMFGQRTLEELFTAFTVVFSSRETGGALSFGGYRIS